MSTAAPSQPDRNQRRASLYRLIWRWHFYAGLFCIPFVLALSLSGSIYLFRPQIDALLDSPYNQVQAEAARRPLSEQVQAALALVPGGVLNAYQRPDRGHASAGRQGQIAVAGVRRSGDGQGAA